MLDILVRKIVCAKALGPESSLSLAYIRDITQYLKTNHKYAKIASNENRHSTYTHEMELSNFILFFELNFSLNTQYLEKIDLVQ